MLVRTLLATVILGILTVSMASGGDSISVLVDARGTYLHTSSDPQAALPTIVELAADGFAPGASVKMTFEIPGLGYGYRCPDLPGSLPLLSTEEFTFGNGELPLGEGAGLLSVFSSSNTLLTPDNHPRVPGATDAGTDIVTANSFDPFPEGEPTDIPEDFQVFPHTGFCVAVPLDATHLFLGVGDSFFGDNCVPENPTASHPRGAIIVTIESSVKGLIAGAVQELSATREEIPGAFGVGDPAAAIESLDKAIADLESSLLSFQEDDPCRLLEDCSVGRDFFRALYTAVGAIFEAIAEGGISNDDILEDLEGFVVEEILESANMIAAIAIQDAEDAAGDSSDIAQAEFHFDMAELLTAEGVSPGVGIEALMFFDDAVGSYRQAWLNARKATGTCGPPGPGALEEAIAELQNVVDGNPGTPMADKIEDVISKLDDAVAEFNKTPPDNQGVVGNIEGVVGELQAAVDDGLLDETQGEQYMDQLAAIAKQLAVNTIDDAIFRGGDPTKIITAEQAVEDGDDKRDSEDFKDAVNKYKDALTNAEGA